jgi:uncharacterized protein
MQQKNKQQDTESRAVISPSTPLLVRPLLWLFLFLIGLYQKLISPLLGPRCRFYPSCSNYAKESLQIHGIFKGGYLAACRCLKCHPFHPGGIDPVPVSQNQRARNNKDDSALNQHNLGETP